MTLEKILQLKTDSDQDDNFKSVLQAKEEQIATLEAKLQAQEVQIIELQAKKELSDTATQFSYLDVAKCKSTIFHALKH